MKILIGTICFLWLGVVFGMYLLSIMSGEIEKKRKEYKKAVSILFLRWLKEHDAYCDFKKNIKNNKCLPPKFWWPINHYKTLEAYLEYVNYKEYINRAFQWNLTPQTEKYWNTLNLEWIYFLGLNNVEYLNAKQIFQLAKNLKRCIEKSKSEKF